MFLDGVAPNSPERHVLETLAALSVASEEIEPYGSDPAQFIEWYGPAEGQPVVFVHGGGFRSPLSVGHARPAALALGEEGYRVALVEMRKERGNPNVTLADLDTLAHLPQLANATWIGHSLGATLAIDVVLDPDLPPTKAIGLAPFCHLANEVDIHPDGSGIELWIGGKPENLPGIYTKLDPRARMKELGEARFVANELNIQIIHGEDDQTIPLARVRGNASTTIRTAIVPGANHVDLIRPGHDAWLFLLGALRAD
ncbi:alpha/beta hydrolase family protein [Arcanobacterium haemolyticum]|uniref:NUDIX family protein n=1 Tax=Arcanobacterium haemolyticum (strain ATCC 9345 / DSM 20595 / CCM 5947 / CCUG 17215 / LMG 16163 / NBRC 15585 / NCTC 8452 / 11018) TaxID=644284 RepID=D7BKH1_ARCHD|nr:alpha/beta hydrolase [Arcanobacterium haemolyticum]ADH93151.1 NUDIX family protein [Arcanobacterium haemolyticum DSM 20595]SQH28091.1 Alpha/beta hydrolase family [Arcanobacterium haemolyticum]